MDPKLGFFRRRFGRWLALSQYGFPFSIGSYPTSVARFRALARRSRFAQRGRLLKLATSIAMTLSWPVGALLTALKTQTNMRRLGRAPNGGLVLGDMYWLALRHSIPPLEYALYQFNDTERRKHMHEFIYWNDVPGLTAINKRLGADNQTVQDKNQFAAICEKHGFPHVDTLAVFDGGRQIYPAALFIPNSPLIWVKSLRLKGGAGAVKWVKNCDDYITQDRRIRTDRLADEFRKQDCLVQPFLENHPNIACISNGALASLRIVSGINTNAGAEFVTAMLSLPHGIHETSVPGILCSIEPTTGQIRRAVLPNNEPITRHPDTGEPIIGRSLPFWRESVDLVLRCHAVAFSCFAFLGWDVALTKSGPTLLEANTDWGAIYHQMLDGPLGRTAFSHLIDRYV